MSQKLRVHFGEGKNGWLPVEVESGEQLISFTASAIPYDALYQLAKALLMFAKLEIPQSVTWNTEPVEFDFVFSKGESGAKLEIIQFSDVKRIRNSGQSLLVVTIPTKDLILLFWRALRELESRPNFQANWPHKFPNNEIELLSNLIK